MAGWRQIDNDFLGFIFWEEEEARRRRESYPAESDYFDETEDADDYDDEEYD